MKGHSVTVLLQAFSSSLLYYEYIFLPPTQVFPLLPRILCGDNLAQLKVCTSTIGSFVYHPTSEIFSCRICRRILVEAQEHLVLLVYGVELLTLPSSAKSSRDRPYRAVHLGHSKVIIVETLLRY